MIEMVPVNSSNIDAVGHCPIENKLHVQFKSGATYMYHDVDADAHNELVNADSIGKHFAMNIKNNYEWEKL